MIQIKPYDNDCIAIVLIQSFWLVHNQYIMSDEEASEDLKHWSSEGHRLYFIYQDDIIVGFIHMGNRGNAIDWLEDIFVLPKYQNQGIGTKAIALMEEIVHEYSISMYIEVAARNEAAIRLYRKLGYDCLNTITIRKDFEKEKLTTIRQQQIYDLNFEIKKMK